MRVKLFLIVSFNKFADRLREQVALKKGKKKLVIGERGWGIIFKDHMSNLKGIYLSLIEQII